MLNDSKKISAVCSRFSGGLRGGSVWTLAYHQCAFNCRMAFTHQKEVVILRLCSEILEYRLLPIPFHMIPVVDHPVANRVVHAIPRGLLVRNRLIADEEVEILHPTFRCERARLRRNWRTSTRSLCLAASSRRDRSGKHTSYASVTS